MPFHDGLLVGEKIGVKCSAQMLPNNKKPSQCAERVLPMAGIEA